MDSYQGQGQVHTGKGSTGSDDAISRFLDKLERKFGGERFNDPANEAKNRQMNQKLSQRIRKIAPQVLRRLPRLIGMMR